MKHKQITIFFNPETYDCYTGVITKTGEVYSFNSNPFHPLGFGQYSGEVTNRLNITYGYSWRNHFDEAKMIKQELRNYLHEARNNPSWLGKEVDLQSLSEEAQKYVKQILTD